MTKADTLESASASVSSFRKAAAGEEGERTPAGRFDHPHNHKLKRGT